MKCCNLNHRAGPDPMPTPPPTPQNAKSQFCTECKAESGLAITAHHTPQACRTPEGPESTESLVVVPVGGGGAWPGFKTTRRATHQRPGPAGVEGAGGPGCGARGRWRGLAGLRDDAPSEARGADGSRAGRRPRAHQAARPDGTRNTSGVTSNTAAPHTHTKTPTRYRVGVSEPPVGIEPTTYSLRVNRSAD